MNRPQLYKETVDILYQAYFNDTLVHRSCVACAIGNIIASRLGYAIEEIEHYSRWRDQYGKVVPPLWIEFVMTIGAAEQLICHDALQNSLIRDQVAATGYEPMEVAAIEYAFEDVIRLANESEKSADESMFDGLAAVLDILGKIHEVSAEDLCLSKSPFENHYKNKCYANTATISAG